MRHALTLTIIIIFGTIGCGDNRAKAQTTTIPRDLLYSIINTSTLPSI